MPQNFAKSQVTVPSRLYQPGTRQVNVPNITTDDNGMNISLTRESWPDTGSDVISGMIEGSNDGTDFFELTRFNYVGGTLINSKTGQVITTCGPSVYWPERYDPGTDTFIPQRPAQVRATITNTVALQTAITLSGL